MLKQRAYLVPRERKHMKKAKLAYRRYELAFSWLFLAAIASSQLAFSAHQFSHEDDGHAEDCPVCAVSERGYDDVVVPVVNTAYACSTVDGHEPRDERKTVLADLLTSYCSRASP